MDARIQGVTRGGCQGGIQGSGQPNGVALSPSGEVLVNQFLPPRAELARLGKTWCFANTTGADSVATIPATVAGFSLYNGNASGGASLVVDRITAHKGVIDVTQTNSTALFACLNPAGVATAITDGNNNKLSMSGKAASAAYDGKARGAITQTVTNSGWFLIDELSGTAAVAGSLWGGVSHEVNGRIIIPPTGMLNLQLTAAAIVVAAGFFSVTFHEVVLVVNQ